MTEEGVKWTRILILGIIVILLACQLIMILLRAAPAPPVSPAGLSDGAMAGIIGTPLPPGTPPTAPTGAVGTPLPPDPPPATPTDATSTPWPTSCWTGKR